jgi:hypothetical protein
MPYVMEPRAGEVWVREAFDRGRVPPLRKDTRRVLVVERHSRVRNSKVTWVSEDNTRVSTLASWRRWADTPTLRVYIPGRGYLSLWTQTRCVHTRAGRAWDPQQAVQLLLQLAEQGHVRAAEEAGFIAAHFDEYDASAMDKRLTELSQLLNRRPLR